MCKEAAKRRQQTDAEPIAAAASRLNEAIRLKPWAHAHGYVLSRLRRWIS